MHTIDEKRDGSGSRPVFHFAIAVLQRNAAVYPASVNVYDSLGDAYDAAGRLDEAKASYQKACAMSRATGHPNTAIYCADLERITEKMESR